MRFSEIKYIILLFLTLSACEWFTTRDPEKPDTGRSTYQPPTSPNIVVSNLANAIKEKNIDNYISCFADSALYNVNQYAFVASADAQSRYTSLFTGWTLFSERQYFTTLLQNSPPETVPLLVMNNFNYQPYPPDTTIYTSEYFLRVNHNNPSAYSEFSGTLQFVILRNNSGLWCIQRWSDYRSQNDSLANTWSILKAQFSH